MLGRRRKAELPDEGAESTTMAELSEVGGSNSATVVKLPSTRARTELDVGSQRRLEQRPARTRRSCNLDDELLVREAKP